MDTMEVETPFIEATESAVSPAKGKSQQFRLNLTKIKPLVIVVSLILFVTCLIMAITSESILLTEGFKALAIIVCLNLIRIKSNN